MDQVQAVIEQACREFSVSLRTCCTGSSHVVDHIQRDEQPPHRVQVPATQAQAERRLQEFQTSRDPIPACQHILQHSRMEHARFHAALTLRQAALRDWPLLSPDTRAGLLTFLMQHLFGCVRSMPVSELHPSNDAADSLEVRSTLIMSAGTKVAAHSAGSSWWRRSQSY